MSVYVKGFSGLGDNIYQKVFIRALCNRESKPVYLETPLPDFYSDIRNLNFVKPDTPWRTQKKMQSLAPESIWTKPEALPKSFSSYPVMSYGADTLGLHSIMQIFEGIIPLLDEPFVFDLPRYDGVCRIDTKKPIAIIRPVTVRREWYTPSRAPEPAYLNWIASHLRKSGFLVISIADVIPGIEWIEGREPDADIKYHSGELSIKEMIDLFHRCAISVGGVGFVTPMGIASGSPHFCVLGGRGKYDCISNITDPRMNLSKFGWMQPDNFCRCDVSNHNCDKHISNFQEKFMEFLTKDAVASHIQEKIRG